MRLPRQLAPHLDAAIDGGFITVADDGAIIVSDALEIDARAVLGLDQSLRVRGLGAYTSNNPRFTCTRALRWPWARCSQRRRSAVFASSWAAGVGFRWVGTSCRALAA